MYVCFSYVVKSTRGRDIASQHYKWAYPRCDTSQPTLHEAGVVDHQRIHTTMYTLLHREVILREEQ